MSVTQKTVTRVTFTCDDCGRSWQVGQVSGSLTLTVVKAKRLGWVINDGGDRCPSCVVRTVGTLTV